MKKSRQKKVLVAMSGGIDSAVSAYLLLKKGYQVEAAFMKNWTSQEGLLNNECPWLEDRRDALRVAAFLNIPLHTLDFEKQYQQTVMKYFFDEYKKGRTPNPDVMCNKEIKFKLLYNWAMKNKFDYLATGHYARISSKNQVVRIKQANKAKKSPLILNTCYLLQRSKDEFKDQTYFIYNIKSEQLPRLMFPIGGMKKTAVRSLARKIGLPNAEKKESMGLCFVGKIRLKDFLQQKLKPKPGKIVLLSSGVSSRNFSRERIKSAAKNIRDPEMSLITGSRLSAFAKASADRSAALAMTGTIIGQHQGLHNFTIGQRQGIKVGGGAGPYYVVKKDLKKNVLYVTNNPEDKRLETKEVEIHSVNWLNKNFQFPISNFQLLGRYRHQGELVPLVISKIKPNLYRVIFKHPQKAVASGQSLVLYKGKECVGGGVIV